VSLILFPLFPFFFCWCRESGNDCCLFWIFFSPTRLTHYYSLSDHSYKMLIKLLVSVYERARSKLTSTRSNSRISSGLFYTFSFISFNTILNHKKLLSILFFTDSDIETTNFDPNSIKQISSSGPLIIQQQPRSSLSKWLCTTPVND
jgi:hypothetical protein